MSRSAQDFMGDGDGPATEGQKPSTRGPLLIMARPITLNWRVGREGDLVTLTLGNASPIRIPAEAAIQLGHALGVKGVEAKIQRGDAAKRIQMRA